MVDSESTVHRFQYIFLPFDSDAGSMLENVSDFMHGRRAFSLELTVYGMMSCHGFGELNYYLLYDN